MSGDEKRFPLSLAAFDEKATRSGRNEVRQPSVTATPQTATRNAAHHLKPQAKLNAANVSAQGKAASGVASAVTSVANAPLKLSGVSQRSSSSFVNRVPEMGGAQPAPMVSEAVRRAMVERVAQQGVRDQKVLAALDAVPRHLFLEPALASQAYIDASLPIGHHQTISQPYIVARMIELMRANKSAGKLDRVLEIGTGCGYQAAVLSLVAKEVYSIERIKPLHELARSNLRPLRIANIRLHYGDGMLGFPQVAPFDGIILAAAGMEVPQALLDQMSIGGRLVAPVGVRHQVLQMIERTSKYDWSTTTVEDCHFVPLRPGTV